MPQLLDWLNSSLDSYKDAFVDVYGEQIAEDANRLADALLDIAEDATLGLEDAVTEFANDVQDAVEEVTDAA